MNMLARIAAHGWAIAALAFSGCALQPAGHENGRSTHRSVAESRSAEEWEQLAQTAPAGDRVEYLLNAAENYRNHGNFAAAAGVVAQLNTDTLHLTGADRLALLRASFAQQQQDTEQVLAALSPIVPSRLDIEQRYEYHVARVIALQSLARYYESAAERMHLNALLGEREQRENNAAILDTLSLVPLAFLHGAIGIAAEPLRAWVDLAVLVQHYQFDATAFERQLADWRVRYPNYPEAMDFARKVWAHRAPSLSPPSTVAVLLPSGGEFAAAAAAVREGLLGAHQRTSIGEQVSIRFYDTLHTPPYVLYQQARQEGADVVIGPLTKPEVEQLTTAAGLSKSTPVLALNQTRTKNIPTLYQFALNPEDEAEQAAGLAWRDGLRQMSVIVPNNRFGARMRQVFTQRWVALGGTVAGVVTYPPNRVDPAKLVTRLARTRTTTNAGVFVTAIPQDGRRAVGVIHARWPTLPLYATSAIFSGRPDAHQDQLLDGVNFCDASWVLPLLGDGSRPEHYLPHQANNVELKWQRMVPFGADAYGLVTYLPQLSSGQYTFAGLTGQIVMDADQRLHRQLYCAQFTNGLPMIRGLAPLVAATR